MTSYEGLIMAAARALDPLTDALTDPLRCRQLLERLGFPGPVSRSTLGRLNDLAPVLGALEQIRALVEDTVDGSVDPVTLERLVLLIQEVVVAIDALGSLDAAQVSGLPGALATPEGWADLAVRLPDLLLADWLAEELPVLLGVLRITGICRPDHRGKVRRDAFRWEALGGMLADPAASVRDTFEWGTSFRAWPFQRVFGQALANIGLPVRHRARQPTVAEAMTGAPVDSPTGVESDVVFTRGRTPGGDAEVGLVFAGAPENGGTLFVGNMMSGDLSVPIPVGEDWSLEVSGAAEGTATLGVRIQPGGLTVVGGEPAFDARLTLHGQPAVPWILAGTATGTRAELSGLRVELGVSGTPEEPDAYVLFRVDEDAFRFVLDLGAADSFLRGVTGGQSPAITSGGELRWSSRSGMSFTGGVGISLAVPLDLTLGPLHVTSLTIVAGTADGGARIALTTVADVTIGPFVGVIQGVGAALELSTQERGAGLSGIDVRLAFIPPTGVGFTVDLGEIGGGGGFVGYDPALGRYFGALELQVLAVELGAIVVVDTRLPGDPDGWALFASVFATFPSVPLGFGFFLSGVGGLVCWNRTLDAEALASGLKSGAIDAILFPDDPMNDIVLILSQLDAWFPTAEGSAVVGIAAKITWGTPVTIITGQLGVAVVFPDLVVALMGSVSMLLPSEDEVLLELHMDSLGVIDVPGGTVMVVASLYDSALLRTINLSGDMAFYLSIGTSPYFLLSIGGYHPDFDPPCGLPAPVLDLARMRADVTISEDVFFALETYVAVTANTLQFGSEATLVASAKVLLTTYTARGSVGFDVLLVFAPFAFAAGFHLDVSVSAGEKELLAVSLAAHLEGPEPWYTNGSATFEFFGVHVGFAFEFGGSAEPETPGCQNVLDLVVAALEAPGAWRPAQPAWVDTTTVVFAEDDGEEGTDGLWIRPDAKLDARQNVAPLDRTLDRFGTFAIDGDTTLAVVGAGVRGVGDEWVTIADWFAPAQYDDLTRTEKLAAPSYEEMTTGVRVSAGSLAFDAGEATTVRPDFEVRVIEDTTTTPLGAQPPAGPPGAALAALALDPARRRPARTVTSATFTARAPTWRTADRVTGTAVGPPSSYRDARLALAEALTGDPDAALCTAPAHALAAAT